MLRGKIYKTFHMFVQNEEKETLFVTTKLPDQVVAYTTKYSRILTAQREQVQMATFIGEEIETFCLNKNGL